MRLLGRFLEEAQQLLFSQIAEIDGNPPRVVAGDCTERHRRQPNDYQRRRYGEQLEGQQAPPSERIGDQRVGTLGAWVSPLPPVGAELADR